MFELLFLLLPVAAAYGYYMGKASSRQRRDAVSNTRAHNYIRGVEYFLNNERERAVDRFIAYFNESDPSFETHVALGNLFRKRGEMDKAISMHEALLSNARLSDPEHEVAQLELARDFIAAGLLDRAEQNLTHLVDIPRQRAEAASLLVQVYERERDFPEAIRVALKYQESMGRRLTVPLSHYYCEVAAAHALSSEGESEGDLYRKALSVNPSSLRARLGLCEVALRAGQNEEAFKLIKEVSALNPDTGLICLEYLLKIFPNKADPKLRFALDDLVRRTRSAAAMVELVETVEQSSGRDDAEVMLLSFVKEKPNLKLFSELMRLRSREEDQSASDAILQLKSLVDAQIASNYRYSCHRCGFQSRLLFWQCPSCRRWDTLKPIRGLDGD